MPIIYDQRSVGMAEHLYLEALRILRDEDFDDTSRIGPLDSLRRDAGYVPTTDHRAEKARLIRRM
jgi:hypothetical protein